MLNFIEAISARDGTGWAGDSGVGLLASCVSTPTPGRAKASMKRATMPLRRLALGCGDDGVDGAAMGAERLAGAGAGGGGGTRRGRRRAAGVARVVGVGPGVRRRVVGVGWAARGRAGAPAVQRRGARRFALRPGGVAGAGGGGQLLRHLVRQLPRRAAPAAARV